MLAYAGMGTIDEERIDLRDVVVEMGDLLRASIPSTIVVDTELDHVPAGVEHGGGAQVGAGDLARHQQVDVERGQSAARRIHGGVGAQQMGRRDAQSAGARWQPRVRARDPAQHDQTAEQREGEGNREWTGHG